MIKRLLLLVLLCCLVATTGLSYAQNQELVLVSSAKNNIEPISLNNLKRLFLGMKTKNTAETLTPIGNHSDTLSHEVFLQKIIHMSARAYERHLLKKVFVRGSQRMKVETNIDELLHALQKNENAVTYMWANQVKNDPEIKIIQTIWRDKNSR